MRTLTLILGAMASVACETDQADADDTGRGEEISPLRGDWTGACDHRPTSEERATVEVELTVRAVEDEAVDGWVDMAFVTDDYTSETEVPVAVSGSFDGARFMLLIGDHPALFSLDGELVDGELVGELHILDYRDERWDCLLVRP